MAKWMTRPYRLWHKNRSTQSEGENLLRDSTFDTISLLRWPYKKKVFPSSYSWCPFCIMSRWSLNNWTSSRSKEESKTKEDQNSSSVFCHKWLFGMPSKKETKVIFVGKLMAVLIISQRGLICYNSVTNDEEWREGFLMKAMIHFCRTKLWRFGRIDQGFLTRSRPLRRRRGLKPIDSDQIWYRLVVWRMVKPCTDGTARALRQLGLFNQQVDERGGQDLGLRRNGRSKSWIDSESNRFPHGGNTITCDSS